MSMGLRRGKQVFAVPVLALVSVLLVLALSGCQGAAAPAAKSAPPASSSQQSSGGEQKSAAPAQKLTVKFSHVVAEDTPKHKAALKFKELAEAKSNGNIEVQVFANSQLYKDREEFEALQTNAVQYLAPGTAKFSVTVPEWQVVDLPFIFGSQDAVKAFADGPIAQELYAKLKPQKMLGLAMWDNGYRYFTNSKRPLKMPADFQGIKFRADGKPAEELAKALGASAQIMAFAEVFNALQQGVVDGQLNTYSNIFSMKFHEVQKYLTDSGTMSYLGYTVVTNEEWYNGLPADQRKILDEAMQEATAYERGIANDENVTALQKIKDSGKLEMYKLNDKELAAWEEAAQVVYKDYEGKIGKELIDKVKALK